MDIKKFWKQYFIEGVWKQCSIPLWVDVLALVSLSGLAFGLWFLVWHFFPLLVAILVLAGLIALAFGLWLLVRRSVPSSVTALVFVGLIAILAGGPRFLQLLSTRTKTSFSDPGGVHLEILIIIAVATFTTWIAIWRGQHAEKQIEKTKEQISVQILNDAISMATDIENPARVRAGFTRLRDLYGRPENKEEEKSLRVARDAAKSILERGVAGQGEGMGQGEGVEKEKRIDARVRQAALRFLMIHPPEEGRIRGVRLYSPRPRKLRRRRRGWALNGYDLSELNFAELLEEVARRKDDEEERRVVARRSDCTGMRARRANLTQAIFSRAILIKADLKGATLEDAILTDANLMCADLTDANLTDVDLTGADLTGADLAGANLKGVILWNVTFKNTQIDRANFQEAKAKDPSTQEMHAMSSERLKGCCWDKRNPLNAPELPNGIDPNSLDDCPRDEE